MAIDQYEGDPTRFTRTIGPTVIRTALNDNVARSNSGLANIHDEGQFALQHDSIVDGLGAVHEGVARAFAGVRRGSGGTYFGEMRLSLLWRKGMQSIVLGRDFKHADPRAVPRWRESDLVLERLARCPIDRRGC